MTDTHRPRHHRAGIELAGAPGAGKARPLSVPPTGFIGSNTAANMARRNTLHRPLKPDAPIHFPLEQFTSHPEGPVS